MRIFTITAYIQPNAPIFNLTHLLVTILGADIRADHEDE
jgi:hypothetical protein